MGDKVERVSVSDIETLGALCDAQKSTGTKLGTDLAYDQMVAALDELLAFREGYDPKERLPENTCDVVVDVVIMDSPSGEIIERQLSYWFEGKWRTFDSDGAEAVLSDGYRVTRRIS